MANIDLTNPDAKEGALAAAKILLKAKKEPIIVKPGNGQGQGGLKAPKNIKIQGDKPDDSPQDPPSNQGDDGDPGTTVQKQDGQNGGDKNKEQKQDGQGQNGEKQENGSKDGQPKPSKQQHNAANAQTMDDIKAEQEEKAEKAQQAADDAWSKIANAKPGDFKDFETDLYDAIAAQVRESKQTEDSYRKGIDPSYAGTDYLMPKHLPKEKREIPLIYIFFDQSVSFSRADVNRGMSALACLDEFVQNGDILKPVVWFFGGNVTQDINDVYRGSTDAFDQVMEIIDKARDLPIGERCNNIIVVSDSDIEGQTKWSKCHHIDVDGCVWWLWKHGSRSQTAMDYLQGMQGNKQYTF